MVETPQVQDKAPRPEGLLPKNVQSWLLVGLAFLMVAIMWLTGGKKPQPARSMSSAAPVAPRVVFAVQVGAFESQRAAEELKQHLEKKYSGVTIQTSTEEKTLYRVRIGEPDIETANKIASELRKDDFKPFVVRLN